MMDGDAVMVVVMSILGFPVFCVLMWQFMKGMDADEKHDRNVRNFYERENRKGKQ